MKSAVSILFNIVGIVLETRGCTANSFKEVRILISPPNLFLQSTKTF